MIFRLPLVTELYDLQTTGTVAEDDRSPTTLSATVNSKKDEVCSSAVLATAVPPAPGTFQSNTPSGFLTSDQKGIRNKPAVSDRRDSQKVYACKKGDEGDNNRGSQSHLKGTKVVEEIDAEKSSFQDSVQAVEKSGQGLQGTADERVFVDQLIESAGNLASEMGNGLVGLPQELTPVCAQQSDAILLTQIEDLPLPPEDHNPPLSSTVGEANVVPQIKNGEEFRCARSRGRRDFLQSTESWPGRSMQVSWMKLSSLAVKPIPIFLWFKRDSPNW